MVEIVKDARDLAVAGTEKFVLLANQAVSERGLFAVALSGGSTPKGLYELLADPSQPFRTQLPWEKIHFFWSDERHVPPDHPDSNYYMVHQALLSRVPLPAENVHRIRSEIPNAAISAEDYEKTIREFFHLRFGEFPRFDLMLLGMGEDGHTASLFPASEALLERERLVVAPWIEKLRSFRITLTLPVLNSAAFVLFLVSGAGKAEVLKKVLQDEAGPELLPAQAVNPVEGTLLWIVDKAAAQLLHT